MRCPRCNWNYTPGAINYIGLDDDNPYVPNEFTVRLPSITWRKLNLGVPMTGEARDPLLEERQKTHGSFEQNAEISQQIKNIFQAQGCNLPVLNIHREALDMIALKLSRILSGQANFKDHWDDIAGYAKLASEACDK